MSDVNNIKVVADRSEIVAIADVVRSKTGKTDEMTIGEIVTSIEEIGSGGEGGDLGSVDELILKMSSGNRYELKSNAVTSVGYSAFSGHKGLKKIDFPNAVEIGVNSFAQSGVETVNLPNVESVGNSAFSGTRLYPTISLPKVTTLGYSVFTDTAVNNISLPSMTSIAANTFVGLTYLESIDIPKVTNIGTMAFAQSGLSSVVLPSVKSIGLAAFSMCTSLTKVDFYALESIGESAFAGCTSLTAVIIRTPSYVCVSDATAFNDTPIMQGTGHVYVPTAMYEYYREGYEPAFDEMGLQGLFDIMFRKIEDYPDICG